MWNCDSSLSWCVGDQVLKDRYFIIQVYETQIYKQSKGRSNDNEVERHHKAYEKLSFPFNIQDWMSYYKCGATREKGETRRKLIKFFS